MKIATTTLACILGLGLTACVEEASADPGTEGTSKTASTDASKETAKSPDVVAMTTTALVLDKVP